MLPLGAVPMLPVIIAPISVRMSPNRLLATTTSNSSGFRTKSMQAASTSSEVVAISEYSAATLSNASSQTISPYPCAFDLVTDVTWTFLIS